MGEKKLNDMMKSIVADTSLESSDKTVVSKLKKANVEQSRIIKVTGHKNIQSLDDYDEANEDEQRQLSYAISGRNNVNPQPPVSREVYSRQELLVSSGQKPISMPNSVAFGLNQSSTLLNPTMMRVQEQNLLNTFNSCQVTFNFKSCKSSRPTIPSVKPSYTRERFRLKQLKLRLDEMSFEILYA